MDCEKRKNKLIKKKKDKKKKKIHFELTNAQCVCELDGSTATHYFNRNDQNAHLNDETL